MAESQVSKPSLASGLEQDQRREESWTRNPLRTCHCDASLDLVVRSQRHQQEHNILPHKGNLDCI